MLKTAMPLKLCPVCKRPFLAKHEFCPRCLPMRYEESWMSFGCLLAMLLPILVMLLFWFFFFFGFFLR